MKTPLPLLLTIAAALSTGIACAQDGPPRPPGDGPRREDDRSPDGDRPPRPEGFDRPGGREFPGERLDRPGLGDRLRKGAPQTPAKLQPYFGVSTISLDPALTAQLGFTPGLGLLVEEVMPDGPAARAGLQSHDVIKQINDQLVANPAQVGALARHFGKDTEVTLLVLRQGQEQKITVKIGERLMRDAAAFQSDRLGGMGFPGAGRLPFEQRGDGEVRRNIDDPNRPRDSRDRAEGPPPPRKSADLFREVGPGGPPEVRSFQESGTTTWSTANAKVSLKDPSGEIEVRSENGKRTLTAKNARGEVAFDGPIDTAEQRRGVPPEFRKLLEQVEAHSSAERRPGQPARAEAGASAEVRPPAEREGPRPREIQ